MRLPLLKGRNKVLPLGSRPHRLGWIPFRKGFATWQALETASVVAILIRNKSGDVAFAGNRGIKTRQGRVGGRDEPSPRRCEKGNRQPHEPGRSKLKTINVFL